MPKLKNITAAEVEAIRTQSEDLLMQLHHLNDMIEKSYCDDIEKPIEMARTFAALARASADTTAKILFKSSLQEQRAELETLLRRKKEAAA